ncbi:MAG: LacI family DNA-binding transcriptional regulator [Aestuariivirga sp.]|uniref:LacI family DNA-binding transcriptional regulator n=1 Tax=Aestuariivirga sp. TaxID=2650926 RepID=UPI003019071F
MVKATIEDVAAEAGVSIATVDRVLNGRAAVRPQTAERVEKAIRRLNYQPDRLAARLARAREYRFCFILPEGSNAFMTSLAEAVQEEALRMAREKVVIDLIHTDVFDAQQLASTLDTIGAVYDGVAVVALDHPRVREALNAVAERGVTVVTLVSDVPSSKRIHYVGIDNSAAGRTAATLMGRYLSGRRGKVGLIAGSLSLRDHIERQFGFEQVMTHDFPNLTLLPVREGRDDRVKVQAVAEQLLADHPDLIGLYNVGAGSSGIAAALEQAGRAREVVFITHELTDDTRRALIDGTIDIIINQDAGHEVRSAIRVLMSKADKLPIVEQMERIRIDIYLRDNIP